MLNAKQNIDSANENLNDNEFSPRNLSRNLDCNLNNDLNNSNVKDELKLLIETGIKHKLKANTLFKLNKFKEAIKEYQTVSVKFNLF